MYELTINKIIPLTEEEIKSLPRNDYSGTRYGENRVQTKNQQALFVVLNEEEFQQVKKGVL